MLTLCSLLWVYVNTLGNHFSVMESSVQKAANTSTEPWSTLHCYMNIVTICKRFSFI
jgi:hypothetical protein